MRRIVEDFLPARVISTTRGLLYPECRAVLHRDPDVLLVYTRANGKVQLDTVQPYEFFVRPVSKQDHWTLAITTESQGDGEPEHWSIAKVVTNGCGRCRSPYRSAPIPHDIKKYVQSLAT